LETASIISWPQAEDNSGLADSDIMLGLLVHQRLAFLNWLPFLNRQRGVGGTQNRMVFREESSKLEDNFLRAYACAPEHFGPERYARRQPHRHAACLARLERRAKETVGARKALAEVYRFAPRNVIYRLQALTLSLRMH